MFKVYLFGEREGERERGREREHPKQAACSAGWMGEVCLDAMTGLTD